MKPRPTLTSLCASTTLPLMGFIVSLVVAIQILLSGCGESPTEAESLKQKQAAAKKVKDETAEAQQKRRADERKRFEDAAQRARADPQYMGIWMMEEYVDKFEEKTGKKYFCLKGDIDGTFSNSATEDSRLRVGFLIDLEDVSVKLYEYGRRLKKNSSSSSIDTFSIEMQDKDGGRHKFSGTMYPGEDRISLNEKWIADFHAIIKKGGPIKFLITEDRLRKYSFTIPEPDGYENALRILTEKK